MNIASVYGIFKEEGKIKRILVIILIFTVIAGSSELIYYRYFNNSDQEIAGATTVLNYRFGVNAGLPSYGTNKAKMVTATSRTTKAHLGWTRMEIYYSNPMHFGYYDTAFFVSRDRGVRTLALLSYPGRGTSMSQWRTYVSVVAKHYRNKIYAWEIMNEADTYLSSSEYARYLTEAYNIIKYHIPNATVVTTGMNSRQEAADFIDGIAAAGAWNKFDAVGLHLYHSGAPEQVNWGGGAVNAEISRIVGSIKRNGGGKKIWITEMGYKNKDYTSLKQGNYLARATIMARTFSEVDKIFYYRLTDNDADRWGLLSSTFQEKNSYYKVQNVVARLNGKQTGERLFTSYNVVDDNDPVPNGWYAGNTVNAGLFIGGDWGPAGMAMTMAYTFNPWEAKAYTSAEKIMGSSWPTSAIGLYVKGDNSKNFLRLRMVDNFGETFQFDGGVLSDNWQHIQFIFGRDPAMVSWGGNGQIDYPLHFHSAVIDKMSGQNSGKIWIDRIAWLPDVDTYAYKFGDAVFYWKAQGSGYYTICGRRVLFNESFHYFRGCY